MSSSSRGPVLSVVMPAYNERATIERIVETVLAAPAPPLELIIVDDCSKDGTREILAKMTDSRIRVLFHEKNQGKGAALRTGFAAARGAIVLVQDADLEYDPSDYPQLLQPILDGLADVVIGSRFQGGPHRVLYFWHSTANSILTLLSNMVTDLNLTDMENCYKVFRREVLEHIEVKENRFGIEPEIVAKIASLGVRIWEVPVRYNGRTYAEGKKIGLKDAFRAVHCIVRYGVPGRLSRNKHGMALAPLDVDKRAEPADGRSNSHGVKPQARPV
ncbi:MAG: glycosyltransferase family 2 protein [Polyangiaceae bacterium]